MPDKVFHSDHDRANLGEGWPLEVMQRRLEKISDYINDKEKIVKMLEDRGYKLEAREINERINEIRKMMND